MEVVFKVNTGVIKKNKHEQTRFNDYDKANLLMLEDCNNDLFLALLRGKVKHCFNDIPFNNKVNINVLIAQNKLNVLSYIKKIRGCFTSYIFKIA